jgi:hypothetical protein
MKKARIILKNKNKIKVLIIVAASYCFKMIKVNWLKEGRKKIMRILFYLKMDH